VLLMLQRQAHSRNRPTAKDEKMRKVFSSLVVISLVGTVGTGEGRGKEMV